MCGLRDRLSRRESWRLIKQPGLITVLVSALQVVESIKGVSTSEICEKCLAHTRHSVNVNFLSPSYISGGLLHHLLRACSLGAAHEILICSCVPTSPYFCSSRPGICT